MQSDEITVGVVSWYSGPLIAALIANLQEKTINSKLRFLVCDNTGGRDEELCPSLRGQCEILVHDPDIRKIRKRGAAGSVSHGQGLDCLFEHMHTKYGLFIDPDCLMLLNGWDVLCKRELTGNTIAIGSPYHSSRFVNYQGFPTAICTLFRTQPLKSIGVDWSAYGISPLTRAFAWLWNTPLNYTTRYLGRLFGPRFYVSRFAEWFRNTVFCGQHRDTGWRVPRQTRKQGYSAQVFTPAVLLSQLDPSCSQIEGIETLLRNYELFLWKGVPILTHFYSAVRKAQEGTRQEQIRAWQHLAHSAAGRLAELTESECLMAP